MKVVLFLIIATITALSYPGNSNDWYATPPLDSAGNYIHLTLMDYIMSIGLNILFFSTLVFMIAVIYRILTIKSSLQQYRQWKIDARKYYNYTTWEVLKKSEGFWLWIWGAIASVFTLVIYN